LIHFYKRSEYKSSNFFGQKYCDELAQPISISSTQGLCFEVKVSLQPGTISLPFPEVKNTH